LLGDHGLIKAAGKSRYALRDQLMVLLAYRHALRASELVSLRWDSVDKRQATIHIKRRKGSTDGVHPLTARELRLLGRWRNEQEPASQFVFTSERGAPFATGGFRTLVARLGEVAGFGFRVHPHQTRLWLQARQ
jgi:integrase